ncbi:MAG: NFACT RNA binding domain-containing protein [Bacteroidota bacterium]
MLGNYFTFVHVSRFIHQQCIGRKISEIYSQHKQQLCITVESDRLQTIIVSCLPSENYIYIREGSFRARKNSVDLFPAAAGKKIIGVTCDTNDRIITIELEENLNITCEMFGSRGNVLMLKEDKTITVSMSIVDAFLKKKELVGSRYIRKGLQPIPAYKEAVQSEPIFLETMRRTGEEGVLQSLKKVIPVLGSTLAKEILLRAGIQPSASMSQAADRDLKKIFAETSSVIAEVTSPLPAGQTRIYFEDGAPVCMSLISLKSYSENSYESFPNVAAATQRFVSAARTSSTFTSDKEQISAWLEKEEKKAAQTRERIADEIEKKDRSAEYELFGKLIMAHLYELRKGLKTTTLEDTLSSDSHDSKVTIPLDPSLTPAQNAEKYFDKAKKAKVAIQESHTRIKTLDRRLSSLRMLIGELSDISSSGTLKEFRQSYKTHLQLLGYATEKEKENLPPFRIFTVEGGFQVLAGKSSENNDMLTTKYAKPDDLWFHCRGSSGSHVVLKVHSAQGEPSKSAIHQAASIAAYYSKMKNASSVPVAMTEKKFVRKPKGAPAGTVVLEREKVLFVEPKLPFIPSV